ncbi:MAG: hypothetical protein ACM3KR_08125 [Deltaproteobacteria bacterium]
MKKILIVSYYYSPGNVMGAVRASKLSKYFNRLGYDVHVVCSDANKLLFMPGEILKDNILESDTIEIKKDIISHSNMYKKLANFLLLFSKKLYKVDNLGIQKKADRGGESKYLKELKKKCIHFLTFVFSLIQDYDFMFRARRLFAKRAHMDRFDVVISTYGPIASHLVGRYVKKNNPDCMWIADFRDPIAQPTNGFLELKVNKKIERSISALADRITAVSHGYLNEILDGKHQYKAQVITNGFDSEDLKYITNPEKESRFSFVYTGTTYAGKRDLSVIFMVLNELINEGKIDKKLVTFRYAGSEQNHIRGLAGRYGLEEIVEAYGFIPRNEALMLQAKSQILLVSTWNESKHQGVLPGKFLEYMMLKKPIIAVINGEVGESEIGKMISEYNMGIYYEAVNMKDDYLKLKDYILMQYNYFLKNGKVLFEGNTCEIDSHNYINITKRFIRIIENK